MIYLIQMSKYCHTAAKQVYKKIVMKGAGSYQNLS